MPSRELLSTPQAAGLLDISTRTMHRWIAKGLIPATKLPGVTGAYVIDRKVVDRLLAKKQEALKRAS